MTRRSDDYRFIHAINEPIVISGPLPPFRVKSRILGGCCEVYVVESVKQDSPGRLVLKTPRNDSPFGDAALRAFSEEALLWSHLPVHPNIVPCIAVERISERPYAIVRYVDGVDCERFFQFADAPRGIAYTVLSQALNVLAEMEDQVDDFSHGDLKPANFLLETVSSGEDKTSIIMAYLTDFGLSRGLMRDSVNMLGDCRYLSPELLRGELYSWKAADIYAFGATALEILTGLPLQWFMDSEDGLHPERISLNKDRPKSGRPGIPTGMIDLLCKLVEKNPDNRPTTFSEVSAGFRQIVEIDSTKVESQRINTLELVNASFITSFNEDPVVAYLIEHRCFTEQEAIDLRMKQSEGTRLVKLGYFDEAINTAETLIERYPWFPLGYGVAGGAYFAKMNIKKSAEYYLRAIEAYNQDLAFKIAHDYGFAEMCYSLSQILHNDNQFEGRRMAVRLAKQATEILPTHPIAMMALGRALLSVHEYAQGLEILVQAHDMFPSETVLRTHLALARCLQKSAQSKYADQICDELDLSDKQRDYVNFKIEQILQWQMQDEVDSTFN